MMKNDKKKSVRADMTALNIVPGTVALSAALLLAFVVLLAALNIGGMIDLPHWAEWILGTADDKAQQDDGFSAAFLASLSGKDALPEGDPVYLQTDDETLLRLLLDASPATSYYQSYLLSRTDNGKAEMTQRILRIVSDDREHAEILTNGRLTKTVTVNATAICITEESGTRRFARTQGSVFTPESEMGLPSLSRMQKMISEAAAGKYTLALSATKDALYIRAEFTDTISGIREVYEVLPDYGLIYTATSYLPGTDTPYYTLTTESLISDITGFSPSIFDMPIP